MKVLTSAEPLPEDERPKRRVGAPLGKEGALVTDLLKLLLKIRSREIDVASRLLTKSDELEALAAGQRTDLPILEGWRFEVFGRDALELVEGRDEVPDHLRHALDPGPGLVLRRPPLEVREVGHRPLASGERLVPFRAERLE